MKFENYTKPKSFSPLGRKERPGIFQWLLLIPAILVLPFHMQASPPPANDLCVNAIPITCGQTITGSTSAATFDNVGTCGTSNTAAGVWYSFTGITGSATLSTCNQASYDTKISVFTGSCAGLNCVGGQDDAAGCAGFTTNFPFLITGGTTYFILVHGFGSNTGNFNLTLTCTAASTVYTVDDNCNTAFDDISGTGTSLGFNGTDISTSDDAEANISMPFDFAFFGNNFTAPVDLRVGNNGGILFNTTSGDLTFINTALPATSFPSAILPFWDDLDGEVGDVYWQVKGSNPNRRLIVQWERRPHFSFPFVGSGGTITFQCILYETTNEICFIYDDVVFGDAGVDYGASATIGLQGNAAFQQYSFNTASLLNVSCIKWTTCDAPQAVCQAFTATLDPSGNVTINASDVDGGSTADCGLQSLTVSPSSFNCSHVGIPQTVTLTITDTNGDSDQCTATVTVVKGTALPAPYANADIGVFGSPGWATWDPCTEMFMIGSSGYNGFPTKDAMHFVYKQMCCDATIIAKVKTIETSTGIPGWAGIMMRESLLEGSRQVSVDTRLTNWLYRRARMVTNGPAFSQQIWRPQSNMWLKLQRTGNFFRGYSRVNENFPWRFLFQVYMPMNQCLWVGLEAESYSTLVETVASFGWVQTYCSEDLAMPDDSGRPEGLLSERNNTGIGNGINVYPNPVRSELNIELERAFEQEVIIEIRDLGGRLLHSEAIDSGSPTLSVQLAPLKLVNGMYLLSIQTSEGVVTKRFVKS